MRNRQLCENRQKNDVMKLLTTIGASEQVVAFYQSAFADINQENVGFQDLEDETESDRESWLL